MNWRKWTVFSLVLLSRIQPSEQKLGLVIKIGTQVFEMAKLAYNVFNVLSVNDETGGTTNQRIGELETELLQRIGASTTSIITNTLLVSKIERIEYAVIAVHSSLIELNNIIKYGDDAYEELFKTYYVNHDVTAHIRFLPKLLTYEIPGTSGKLLDLWIENTRCNMTSLYVFKQFYFELVSSGVALQSAFNYLKVEIDANSTVEEWTHVIEEMEEVFDSYENTCKSRFVDLATDDISNIKDANELSKVLDQRYPWKVYDIYFLKPYGTFQFIYHESKGERLIWKQMDDSNRLVVFIDRDDLDGYVKFSITDGERFRSSLSGVENGETAKNAGTSVKNYISRMDKEYDVKILLSFFDGYDEFKADTIRIHKGKFVSLLLFIQIV